MAVGTGLWIWNRITSCAPKGSLSSVTYNKPAISVQHKDFTQRLLCRLTSRQHIHIKLNTKSSRDTASKVSLLLAAVYLHHWNVLKLCVFGCVCRKMKTNFLLLPKFETPELWNSRNPISHLQVERFRNLFSSGIKWAWHRLSEGFGFPLKVSLALR